MFGTRGMFGIRGTGMAAASSATAGMKSARRQALELQTPAAAQETERKFWVGGNWKCNGDSQTIKSLIDALNGGKALDPSKVEVVCAPPLVYLERAKQLLRGDFTLAAQNMWVGGEGAFTGETSASMLSDMGAEWAIVGHSERRALPQLRESDSTVALKVEAALKAGLKVVLCVGETLEERESERTLGVISRQLIAVARRVSPKSFQTDIVIAYEPVWAIGTGKVASPSQAQHVHAYIRSWMTHSLGEEAAESVRVVYGGSVNAQNAHKLAQQPDIDGFLVGGASLKAEFLSIVDSHKTDKLSKEQLETQQTSHQTPPTNKHVKHVKQQQDTRLRLDVAAIARYFGATGAQMGLLTLFLASLERVFAYSNTQIPTPFAAVLFAFLSVRSRIFSVMDNSRPTLKKNDQAFSRKMPKWTPPRLAFPIIWSTIAVLRALSSSVIFQATGNKLISPPLLAFCAHLCIGDTWNTINNVEKRLGPAVIGVLTVLASVATVDAVYFATSKVAGLILLPSVVWITIASALVTQVYRLNNPGDGSEPLYPVKGRASAAWRVPFTSLTK